MRADSDIETPLWKTKSLAEYEEVLLEFADFFGARATPTLSLLSHAALPDGSVKLSWQLSAEWPSMWRSRINLIGQSVLTFAPSSSPSSPSLVRSVRETWHQKPAEAFFKQVLPKPRDVATFWCSPTAEEIPQPLVQRLGGIEIRKLPPMLALQASVPSRSSYVSTEWVETGDLLFENQAPIAPSYAYTGEVKRIEWYSTVSPGILERRQRMLTNPQRGRSTGWRGKTGRRLSTLEALLAAGVESTSLHNLLPEPDPDGRAKEEPFRPGVVEQSVQYVRRPSQIIAAMKLNAMDNKELASQWAPLLLAAAAKLTEQVEASGRRVVKSQGKPVFMQVES
ncbi:MAG: hypothetical protein SGPRY_003932 [Prymnesium sp.]